MSEAFLKAFRWLILAECVVIGTTAFIISNDRDTVAPIIVGVLAYGVVYIMSYFWREFREKILLASFFVFLVLTFASAYVPDVLFVLLGLPRGGYNEFILWGSTVGVLGVPIMTLIFYRYD